MRKAIVTLLVGLMCSGIVLASVQNTIIFQGRLRESDQPYSGSKTMQFSIYTQATGGTAVWTSGALTVAVTTGTFSCSLDMTGLDLRNGPFWIETTINSQVHSPRAQMSPVGLALHAAKAEEVARSAGNICFSIGSSTYATVSPTGLAVTGDISLTGSIAGYVNTSGDQTVNGVKTFGSIPVLPASDPTTANQAARKAYVDGLIASSVGAAGASGQTLRSNGSGWVASSFLINDGACLGVGTSPEQVMDVYGILQVKRVGNADAGNLTRDSFPLYLNGAWWSGTGSTSVNWKLKNTVSSVLAPRSRMSFITPGDSEAMSIRDDGYVGIGLTNPGYKLDVNGDIHISAGSKIYFGDGSNIATAGGGSATAVSANDNSSVTADADSNGTGRIQFLIAANERMSIANSGKIGMGIINPSAFFETYTTPDTSHHGSRISFHDTTAKHGITITGSKYTGGTAGNEDLFLVRQAQTDNTNTTIYSPTSYSSLFLIDKDGNVGIGTTPGYKLDVNGDMRASTYRFNSGAVPYISANASAVKVGGVLNLDPSSNNNVSLFFGNSSTTGLSQIHDNAFNVCVNGLQSTVWASWGTAFPMGVTVIGPAIGGVWNGSTSLGQVLDVVSAGLGSGGATFSHWRNDINSASSLMFKKSRNNTPGVHTAVTSADILGSIQAYGSDGSAFQSAASIEFYPEGTINSGIVPGKMLFRTTDTSGVSQLRMSINSDGYIGIGTNDASSLFVVNGGIATIKNNYNGNRSFLIIENASVPGGFVGDFGNIGSDLKIQATATASFTKTNIHLNPDGGNVGIGKTPEYKLDVNGDVNVGGSLHMNLQSTTGLDIASGAYWYPPAGVYNIVPGGNADTVCVPQIYISGAWRGVTTDVSSFGVGGWMGGMLVCDGTSVRIYNPSSSTKSVFYQKF